MFIKTKMFYVMGFKMGYWLLEPNSTRHLDYPHPLLSTHPPLVNPTLNNTPFFALYFNKEKFGKNNEYF